MQAGADPGQRRYLVTGGAGFVGSHAVKTLLARGDDVAVLDDLSQGHAAAVPHGATLIDGSLAQHARSDAILAAGPWDGVLHFAALSVVGDSMREPMRYLQANAGDGIAFIAACVRHKVRRFVLSSTANLYGDAEAYPIPEDAPLRPSSAYGESKLMIERALAWAHRAHGLEYVSLRYFNAAGCDPDGMLGEDHDPETHLIPLAIDASLGRRPPLIVHGTDYPTRDGTCLRDYVHVADLAEAHILAVQHKSGAATYNIGSGAGATVLEIIAAVERVTGRPVPWQSGPRRPGDPAALIASIERARTELGWNPRFSDLETIVATAYAWRLAHPQGYAAPVVRRRAIV